MPSHLGRCLPTSAFLALRCTIFLFWFGITIWSVIDHIAKDRKAGEFFIYLTHWAMLWELTYLLCALALGMLATYGSENMTDSKGTDTPWFARVGYCLQSVTYVISFFIFVLYWTLVYNGTTLHAISVFTHGVNFMVAFVDLLLAGLPCRLAQLWATLAFGMTYVLFSLVYDLSGGGANGKSYIYEVLDWSANPGWATLYAIVVVWVAFPLVFLACMHVVYPLRAQCECCPEKRMGYKQAARTEAAWLKEKGSEPASPEIAGSADKAV